MLFFQWSPSSRLVLVASADEIHVFSALEQNDNFRATIRNPAPPAAKLVYVGFGASDTDVCVCASLGLKFAVFNLASSKAVDVANPKFHTTALVRKGFCFRPESQHLAVITRTSGKDMISIHHPKTKELQRSWSPDTIDAQGVVWSPDGKWLVTWESAAHGHKVLFYTPDGNLFKTWSGPQSLVPADADIPLGPGVRLLDFSADAINLVIGDSSRRICIINMTSVTESLRLLHPNTIVPTDTLQVRHTFSTIDSTSTLPILTAIGMARTSQQRWPPLRQGSSDDIASKRTAKGDRPRSIRDRLRGFRPILNTPRHQARRSSKHPLDLGSLYC